MDPEIASMASSAYARHAAGRPTSRTTARSSAVDDCTSVASTSRGVPPGGNTSISLKWDQPPSMPGYAGSRHPSRSASEAPSQASRPAGVPTPRRGSLAGSVVGEGFETGGMLWQDDRTAHSSRQPARGKSVGAPSTARGSSRGPRSCSRTYDDDEEEHEAGGPPRGRRALSERRLESGTASLPAGRSSEAGQRKREGSRTGGSVAELLGTTRPEQFRPPSRAEPPASWRQSTTAERIADKLGGAGQARNSRAVEATRYFQEPRKSKPTIQPSADWKVTETNRYFLEGQQKGKARASVQPVGGRFGGGGSIGGSPSASADRASNVGSKATANRRPPTLTEDPPRLASAAPPPSNAPLLQPRGVAASASQSTTCEMTRPVSAKKPDLSRLCVQSCAGVSEADSLPLGVEWSTYMPPAHFAN